MRPTRSIAALFPLLVAALGSTAWSEYVPPARLEDYVKSRFVLGHFERVDGHARFVAERPADGKLGGWFEVVNGPEDGPILIKVAVDSPFGGIVTNSVDGRRSQVWFGGVDIHRTRYMQRVPSLRAAPAELYDGLVDLKAGRPPSLEFRVLQQWDARMQRNALEKLHADEPAEVVERLNAIAADPRSAAAFAAFRALGRVELLDVERHWETWLDHEWDSHATEIGRRLAAIDAARVAGIVRSGLQSPRSDRDVRRLGDLGDLLSDEERFSALVKLTAHESPDVSLAAVELLGKARQSLHGFGADQDARATLEKLADEPLQGRFEAELSKSEETRSEKILKAYVRAVSPETLLRFREQLAQCEFDDVRAEAVRLLGAHLQRLYHARENSVADREAFEACERLLIPYFEHRIVEDDHRNTRFGIQWAMKTYRDPPWSPETFVYDPAENVTMLMNRLSQRDETADRAGRELTRFELDRVFAELDRRLAAPEDSNTSVFKLYGRLDSPRSLERLRGHLAEMKRGDRGFEVALRAAARLDLPEAKTVVRETLRRFEPYDDWAVPYPEVMARLDGRDVVPTLQRRARTGDSQRSMEVLVQLGDEWAIAEMCRVAAAEKPRDVYRMGPDRAAMALRFARTKAVDAALREHLVHNWPKAGTSFWYPVPASYSVWVAERSIPDAAKLHQHLGERMRPTIAGELARRDPHWLAELALAKMGEDDLVARRFGHWVFHGLTGRAADFDPYAYASDREAPLNRARAWWAEHAGDAPDDWLLSYFAQKGFALDAFDADAIPLLVQALDGDAGSHGLAVEALSRITDLEFDTRRATSHRGQEYTTTMVVGKLRHRGWLPKDETPDERR